jgi:predicted nucleic acid-binding protein
MELRLGCALRGDFEKSWSRLSQNIISRISIIPFGQAEALIAGDVLAYLQRTGQSIGVEDAIIASTALQRMFPYKVKEIMASLFFKFKRLSSVSAISF